MTYLILFPLFFLLSVSISVANEHSSFYINSISFYDVEPVPFQQFETDWRSKYRGGNTALTYLRHDVGFSSGRWGVGYVYRSGTYIQFNPETASLVNVIETKKPIYGDSYPIDVSIKSYTATGWRFFYALVQQQNIDFQIGVTALQGENLVEGSIKGDVVVLSESDYRFDNIVLDYFYSEDKVFNHQAAKPKGSGYAFDAHLFWQPALGQKIWLDVQDISGRINWRDAPYTRATIESDNKTYDENGYVKVNSVLKGRQLTKNFTQYLPISLSIKTELALHANYALLLELDRFSIKAYSRVGLRKQILANMKADVVYDPLNRTLGLRLSHKMFQFGLLSDNINLDDAYMLAVTFNLRADF